MKTILATSDAIALSDGVAKLTQNHQVFTDYILSLNEQEYEYAAAGKWSAGQQLEMLYFTTYHVQHHQELIKKYLEQA
jgi:hypothetical protein